MIGSLSWLRPIDDRVAALKKENQRLSEENRELEALLAERRCLHLALEDALWKRHASLKNENRELEEQLRLLLSEKRQREHQGQAGG